MLKLLKISYVYDSFLRKLYKDNPFLKQESYDAQYDFIVKQHFYESDSYEFYLNKLGYETKQIIANAMELQDKWAKEHNINKKGIELLKTQIEEFKPNILFIQEPKIFDHNSKLLNKLKRTVKELKIVIIFKCSPVQDKSYLILNEADLILTCSKSYLDYFFKLGYNVSLLEHAFDTRILNYIDSKNKIANKVVFAGSIFSGQGYHSKRQKYLLELVKRNILIDIYSENIIKNYEEYFHNPSFGIGYYQTLANYQINFNIHIDSAESTAGNLRMFETTGLGRLLVTDNQSNISDFFDADREIIVYDSIEDAIDKIQWLLDNPAIASKISDCGQKRTLTYYTFEQKVNKFDVLIKKLLNII